MFYVWLVAAVVLFLVFYGWTLWKSSPENSTDRWNTSF